MDYKPSDFFIGVIDFFGILVPGAVFLYLEGTSLAEPFGPLWPPEDQVVRWIVFILGSYVFGQFLLGLGVPLNRLLGVVQPEKRDGVYHAVKEALNQEVQPAIAHRKEAFYRAYAYVRLHSPAALTEIERQTADYKLFRSLTLVFALDLLFVILFGAPNPWRWIASAVLFGLAAERYLFLLGWTYRITFEYYALVKHDEAKGKKNQQAPAGDL
jgi:hypothetical protein